MAVDESFDKQSQPVLEIGKTIVKRWKNPFRKNAYVDAETNNFIISKIFYKM